MELEQKKKLSHYIERGEHDILTWTNNYIYKFKCNQYLEKIDDLSSLSSHTYNEIKQICIDNLVNQFRIALNAVVFGDPAGKEYVEYMESLKQDNETPS